MSTVLDGKVFLLRNEYGLNKIDTDKMTSEIMEENENLLAIMTTNEEKEDFIYNELLKQLKADTDSNNTLEPQVEKVVNATNKKGEGWDVILVTHKDVMTMYDEASYRVYATLKASSNFEGTTIEEWNNYIRKRGAKQVILDLMEGAKAEFNGKIPASRTVERQITKLINNGIPLIKVENHNGKVYYKLLNCIDGHYYVRIPYEKVRELVVSTSNNALKICAVMTYLCDEKTSKAKKVYKNGKVYFTITRECVAEAIGLSSNSNRGLDDIGITLTSLCNLGFLERFKENQISKDGNTYKTIHSYRITTLTEYKEAKNRGTIE